MTVAIGVSPGATATGIIVRTPTSLCHSALTVRGDSPFDWYIHDVVDAVTKAKDLARNLLLQAAPLALPDLTRLPLSDFSDWQEAVEVGQVAGAVAGRWLATRIVVHRVGPLASYPKPIQPRALFRCRAAWDLAGDALIPAGATK